MKRLNAYYVISIVTLAFMFLILMRTLQAIGWFEDEPENNSVQELMKFKGEYSLVFLDSTRVSQHLLIETQGGDKTWMNL